MLSAACTASASRFAPLSMSWKQDGSGRKSRILGSRWRARSARSTPRAISSSSTRASMPRLESGSRRHRHGWPVTDFSTLSADPIGPTVVQAIRRSRASARLPAIFCGYAPDRAAARAHHDALRGHDILAAVDPFEQRAVGDSGGGEDAVALGHVLERVDPLQVFDPPAPRARDLVVVAEH